MFQNLDDFQKLGKDGADAAMKSMTAVTKSVQAIAVEVADYSKKSFEQGSAVLEKMMGAKSLDKAIELQTDYLKSAYEGLVTEATKIGGLYADLAKEVYKPYETTLAKITPVAK